ncbi:type VII secretion protein EssC [Alkalihalobacterium chitinilyticum]|uniref:Type VII secretion protein EssC n=1 Tax=Alkalihalobacterium chitinilyticum TaxID=2980103 RepID=A0ABT5VIH3_9BACI|nr:type VII secretion protein EssC [Alkalihalobacterium chitinilyticum]MDE5415224.1 type VII secretion protein EssC [Alkalihalobacterium chitinilyticum]
MAQTKLFILFDKQLQKCSLPQGVTKEITVSSDWSDTVTFTNLAASFVITWDGEACTLDGKVLTPNKQTRLPVGSAEIEFLLVEEKEVIVYDLAGVSTVTFGSSEQHDIQLKSTEVDFSLMRTLEQPFFQLMVNRGEVYHNNVCKDSVHIEPGDQLYADGISITIHSEDMEIAISQEEPASTLTRLMERDTYYSEEYPNYHRSPRVIYREPTKKQTIAKPPPQPSKPSEQIARTVVPSLVMIAAFVLLTIFQPRGIYIVVMLAMTVTTILVSVIYYVKNVKQYKVDTKERLESYREYLHRKTKELYQISEDQRHSLRYHFPNIEQMRDMAIRVDARIYEKTRFHHDFLQFRTGLGTAERSFEIDFNEEEFTQEKDILVDEARELLNQYDHIREVPVVASLMKGPVGYIGQRHLVLEQLQLLAMQIGLFQSYHDVQIITVFPEEEKEQWNWMRWLPHASLRDVNVRGFVYHERSRDQVLYSMYQILKERKQVIDEKGNTSEKTYFFPHYVVLITDEKLILDHTIMEFFNEDPSILGVSLVFVQDVMQSLPEHVKTVIDIRDSKTGNIILEEGELVNRAFVPDHFPATFDKEEVSRALAPINHLQSLKNSIPESVTFLEMYGVERVEELEISARWQANETYKSLAVPLGLRGKQDIVQLNLHEKAHGPHGLVAGTTGSGKSEIIQSYILSLSVNFHPYEVAFLLIDYKGGGMANLFKNLPHLVGTITNLDRSQSMRALASIKAELQKRQRLFGENDVNHINQYQKLYKQGKVQEPMPHLFLISDEFAELKSEQPDFMKELVSTARIGRSLGIHLILATQKPSGIVDDQIWSNSKFKLALKVQNASDSNEILKTPDAAEITLPGRAYLQVGNNEIYELFQSAWSGADYIPDQDDFELVDTTIYAINDLGQYDILTEDLSGLGRKDQVEKVPTELDAVIDHIHDYAEEQEIVPLPRPWLPPLPEQLTTDELHVVNFEEAWEEEKKPLKVTIGLLDQPELQSQSSLTVDFTKDGHIAVFASPGYGKSTFLQTIVMDLSRQHSPEHFHVYLLDFGTNGLLPLKGLPHVADTILVDEMEKVGKLIRLLTSEIKKRKQLLSQYGVANLAMYEKASGEIESNVLLVIDNFDTVRDTDFSDEFEKIITQIAREGASVGIHLAISAGRQGALRMPLLSNIKTQIPLYLIEQSEARSIIGRTDLEIEEIPGRGLVKLEEPALFQTMLPAEGTEALEIIDSIQRTAQSMDAYWQGERPEAIPMMPEGVIDFEQFKRKRKTKKLVEQSHLPLGLDFEEVAPIGFDLEKDGFLTVVSDRKDGLDNMINAISKSMTLLTKSFQTMIIDTPDQGLTEIGELMNKYISDPEDITAIKENILTEVNNRMKGDHNGVKWMILIRDLKDFAERSILMEEDLSVLFEQGPKVDVHLIVCGDASYINTSYEKPAKVVRSLSNVGLVSMRLGDQDIFSQPFIRKETYPKDYEAYYARDHQHIKIKLPK